MPLTTDVSDDGKVLTFHVTGNMDFSVYRAFIKAADDYAKDDTKIVVDFCNKTKMRDSGLGLLLSLSGRDNKEIGLINCTPEITNRIKSSSYNSIFNLGG